MVAKNTKNVEPLKFSILNPESAEVPTLVERKIQGKSYVNYGEDNNFPEYLWGLYNKSAILQAIINGTADYVYGNGVTFYWSSTYPSRSSEVASTTSYEINKDGDTIDDIVKRIATDYMIFGGFALHVIKNSFNQIKEIYWLDMRNIRVNEDKTIIYYSDKWNKYGCKAIEYEAFDPEKNQLQYVYYFNGHLTRGVYPTPRYVGALASIETSCEIGKYHLNNILNNFTPSMLISFNNGVPSETEKKEIETKLKDKFAGTGNAGKFMVSFNESKENETTMTRMTDDKLDEKYQSLIKSTREEIFISFRATPALFGLNPENNGFSKQEFLESFELYNKTVVQPIQKDIERVFGKIFNQTEVLKIKKFELESDGDVTTIEGK